MAKKKSVVQERITFKVKDKTKRKKKRMAAQPRAKLRLGGDLSMQPYTRELACSIVDPFECSACIPDGRTNTGCFTLKNTGTLGTGVGGSACGIAICGSPQGAYYVDTLGTAATATVAGNWSQLAIATVSAQYQSARAVSYGLRINYVGNTQSDQGMIVVGQLPYSMTLNNLNGLNMGQIANLCSDYREFSLRNGAQITWRPEDITRLAQFWNFGSGAQATNVIPAVSGNIIFAWVFGTTNNTQSLCQYEFVMNFEGQFSQQQYIPGGIQSATATLPKAEVGWYEKMKNAIDKIVPIIPLVGSTLTALGLPGASLLTTMGSMGNGVRYPATLGRSSLL